jgi:hypothetical protein
MDLPLSNRSVARALAVLAVFGAISACIGAVLATAADGAGVPVAHLAGSPFKSYFFPGLILGVIVGGTQLTAAVLVIARRRYALLASTVAGFGMMLWIFIELAMMRQFSWLQAVYFGLGGLELVPVLAILGIVPALVDPLRTARI